MDIRVTIDGQPVAAGEVLGRIGVGCPTRDSDAQTPPEARSCVTVRCDFFAVPAQIGQRRTR